MSKYLAAECRAEAAWWNPPTTLLSPKETPALLEPLVAMLIPPFVAMPGAPSSDADRS